MEGPKQLDGGGGGGAGSGSGSSSSPSSFTSELFGFKDSSYSAGILGSIFAPESKVLGRESVRSEVSQKKDDPTSESWKTKVGVQDDSSKANGGQESQTQSMPSRDMSSIYQEQSVQPCHLSSSIYYGGQDIYSQPQNSQSYELNSAFKNDAGEDDPGSASRGNWWQGSLYY